MAKKPTRPHGFKGFPVRRACIECGEWWSAQRPADLLCPKAKP
jgi:hypothetical protein